MLAQAKSIKREMDLFKKEASEMPFASNYTLPVHLQVARKIGNMWL